MTASKEKKPKPLIVVATLDYETRHQIHDWAKALAWPEGTKLKGPTRYHITLIYCPSAASTNGAHSETSNWVWARGITEKRFWLSTTVLDGFTKTGGMTAIPIVLRFEGLALTRFADELLAEASMRGLEPARFEELYNPHLTIAQSTAIPEHEPLVMTLKTAGVTLWDD